jgi:hypothetical protein
MATKVWQYELTGDDGSILVCWLPRKLRGKTRLTLKDVPDRWWTVSVNYSTVGDSADLHKPWRVGGLL